MLLSGCHLQLEVLPGDLAPVEVLGLDYMVGIVVVLAVQTVSGYGLLRWEQSTHISALLWRPLTWWCTSSWTSRIRCARRS